MEPLPSPALPAYLTRLIRAAGICLPALVLAACPPPKPVGIDTGLPDSAADDSQPDDTDTDPDDTDAPVDADGDGSPASEDCDDGDAAIHPDAAEVCDGIDQDCDGVPDDGLLQVLYTDGDGDGYGAGEAAESCPAAGRVEQGGDCDDGDAAVNPAAEEICDGADQDCDGQTDEALIGTVYTDADGDGYGAGAGASGCLDQPGTAPVDGDCDDGDFFVYPGQLEQCDGLDNDCNGQVDDDTPYLDWFLDGDGDGYGDAGSALNDCRQPAGYILTDGDCDDSASGIYPGATEVCDGLDNNCDGATDEGVGSTFWRDADGDGWGDATSSADGCSAPAGFVAQSGDCNDGDRAQYPGLAETCDGLDNDCSGTADDIYVTRYQDSDRDGYGDAGISASFSACASSGGYVDDATDCDDGDGAIYPGAAETCNSADDDCDGATDEGVTTTFYADADNDGYGDPASTTQACATPAGYTRSGDDCDDLNSRISPAGIEVCNGDDDDCDGLLDEVDADGDGWYGCSDDCDDTDDTVNPGVTEVCYDGIDQDCDGTANGCPLDASINLSFTSYVSGQGTGTSYATAGYSVAVVPDADGDGDDEVLIGATGVLAGQGATYLLEGPALGSGSLSAADATWIGSGGNEAGYHVGAAVWDDGSSQLLISTNGGDAYILDATNRLSGTLASAAHTTLSVSGASALCCGMHAGDLDGDGLTDLLVEADADDANGLDAGRLYLARGPLSGAVDLSTSGQVATIIGTDREDRAGRAQIVPDLDGDGLDEVLVGAWQADGQSGASRSGSAYLLLDSDLPGAGSVLDLSAATAVYYDIFNDSRVGWSLCGADLTGDGTTDLVIGAPGTNGDSAVYVADGTDYATNGGVRPVRSSRMVFDDANNHLLGQQVDCSTDLDGDGAVDLIFSAPNKDFLGRNRAGVVYVAYGPVSSGSCSPVSGSGCVDATIGGASSGDNLGYGLAAGDVDGDGFGDLLLGAPETGASAGTVYLIPNLAFQ